MEQFIILFGDITLSQVIAFGIAVVFLFKFWKKFKEYTTKKYEEERQQREQMQEVIDQAKNYPVWRQQSLDMQKQFTDSISELEKGQRKQAEQLNRMEESNRKRELSKMFNRLLTCFQYYTSKEKNPKQEWTEMEASSFWSMFEDYEELGGNGYMHTEVKPKMDMLITIPMHETEKVAELMQSRK